MIKNRWKITIVDGASSKEEIKEVEIEGGVYSMLRALSDFDSHVGDMFTNSIGKMTIEWMPPIQDMK